ncbi:MAG TPA: BatA and WFA domain-containing protein, partial [Planctomycetota bacterium]
MTFLDPVAFAWLGLAAPIVALYFLKMRRRRVQVASTWLWRKSINDLRVNAPFQRLRKSLLLLLQLLLVILGALALARPSGKAAPPEHKRWAILIDRSASMRMKDVAPSRLEKAKALALQAVKEGGPDDEFMVVAFSSRAQILSPMTGDRGAVERAIDGVEPTDAPTRIQEAYRLAASALEGAKLREIVVLSDGGVEPIQGAEDIPLRYVPVGGKPRNAAVTALDVRRPSKGDDPWTVFAQIDLFHDKAAEVPV